MLLFVVLDLSNFSILLFFNVITLFKCMRLLSVQKLFNALFSFNPLLCSLLILVLNQCAIIMKTNDIRLSLLALLLVFTEEEYFILVANFNLFFSFSISLNYVMLPLLFSNTLQLIQSKLIVLLFPCILIWSLGQCLNQLLIFNCFNLIDLL